MLREFWIMEFNFSPRLIFCNDVGSRDRLKGILFRWIW